MTEQTIDPALWQAQVNENVQLRQRIAELEADSDAIDADLDEGALLMDTAADMIDVLRQRIAGLEAWGREAFRYIYRTAPNTLGPGWKVIESAPIGIRPETEPPASNGVKVHNYAEDEA